MQRLFLVFAWAFAVTACAALGIEDVSVEHEDGIRVDCVTNEDGTRNCKGEGGGVEGNVNLDKED